MSRNRDVGDMMCAARRGELDAPSERQLTRDLAASAELQLLHRATTAIDEDGAVRIGDERLVGDVIERTVAVVHGGRARPRRSRWRAVAMASVAVVASSVAAARLAAPKLNLTEVTAPLNDMLGISPARSMQRTSKAAARRVSRRTSAVQDGPDSPRSAKTSATRPADPTASGGLEATPLPSAAPATATSKPTSDYTAVFRAANEARRAGQVERAMALYTQVIRLAPSSAEAVTSRLALAKLLLRSGRPEAAVQQFRAARRAGGATELEALWGEAEALRMVGNVSGERRLLERIVSEFRGSAYEALARRRLEQH